MVMKEIGVEGGRRDSSEKKVCSLGERPAYELPSRTAAGPQPGCTQHPKDTHRRKQFGGPHWILTPCRVQIVRMLCYSYKYILRILSLSHKLDTVRDEQKLKDNKIGHKNKRPYSLIEI